MSKEIWPLNRECLFSNASPDTRDVDLGTTTVPVIFRSHLPSLVFGADLSVLSLNMGSTEERYETTNTYRTGRARRAYRIARLKLGLSWLAVVVGTCLVAYSVSFLVAEF